MEKNIDFTTQLYREILHYATDANYNLSMKALEELAYKAGYTKQELIELIQNIYESLPVAFSFPQEK